ncbi:hypothetical protein B5J93_05375 [Moraxella equi]|uniref:Uncharacterized protein n=1 Tax=Moraxella equi TaxID=60442 RepID=A0ABX3NKC2_9GAMM|nr:hypothetical protein B5J93_05375 [Moraxella equi]
MNSINSMEALVLVKHVGLNACNLGCDWLYWVCKANPFGMKDCQTRSDCSVVILQGLFGRTIICACQW